LQRLLKTKGYYTGEIDGALGKGSREAIRAYQQANGVAVDGEPTSELLDQLRR
jgi:membrane-bound lytic murein transglycosylase B